MRITRRLEFDSGHRIPDHQSQCRHLHGHRYAIEITLRATSSARPDRPLNGMVMDFSDIKTLARQNLVDAWDHAFLVWRGDTALLSFLESLPGHKTVVLDSGAHRRKPGRGGIRSARSGVPRHLRQPPAP
jgi:6-pyruvoyltetrahydropterin/6-carboxytetrahydropterin synthase